MQILAVSAISEQWKPFDCSIMIQSLRLAGWQSLEAARKAIAKALALTACSLSVVYTSWSTAKKLVSETSKYLHNKFSFSLIKPKAKSDITYPSHLCLAKIICSQREAERIDKSLMKLHKKNKRNAHSDPLTIRNYVCFRQSFCAPTRHSHRANTHTSHIYREMESQRRERARGAKIIYRARGDRSLKLKFI